MRKPDGMQPQPSGAEPPRAPMPSARLRRSPPTSRPLRLAASAAALHASCLLAGCATTGSTATTARAQCAPWRAITYASKRDTPETVRQVRVHNRTGEKIGCWR